MVCQSCGAVREVSYEHWRRLLIAGQRVPCAVCDATPILVRDEHVRWWLVTYGVNPSVIGRSARVYARTHPLPNELLTLAASAFPK